MIRLWETGLLGLWKKQYLKVPEPCFRSEITKEKKRLKLMNFSGTFYILLLGYTLALLAFLNEIRTG
jgi:hypothetical protein